MHIDITGSPIKRPREESGGLEQPPLKKTKIESSYDSTVPSLDCWNTDTLKRICLFLPTAKDIFNFELLFKTAIEQTAMAWKRCAQKDLSKQGLNIDWPLYDKEPYKERACYIHGAVLSNYIKSRKNILSKTNRGINDIKNLFARFKGIMTRYPSFLGAYLWKDLNQLEKIYSWDEKIFRTNSALAPSNCLTAGGLLLEGLSHLSEHLAGPDDPQKQQLRRLAFTALSEAAQKGAACASNLASYVLYSNYPVNDWYYHLALSSIDKKDYLGLRLLVDRLPVDYIKNLYTMGTVFPPILARIASHSATSDAEKESLFDEAIRGYQGYAPATLCANACLIKSNLRKWKEAENYVDTALNAYKEKQEPIPARVWVNAFQIQFHFCDNYKIIKNKMEFDEFLNKGLKAIDYGYKVITSIEENNALEIWIDMAYLYTYFSLWDSSLRNQINTCLDKGLASLESNKCPLSPDIYFKMGLIKTMSNRGHIRELNQAKDYFEIALNICEKEKKEIPSSFYTYRGYLKLVIWDITKELNTLQEAEADIYKGIEMYKEQVLPYCHLCMALVKKSLDKWEEAEEYADKAKFSYKEKMPLWLIPDLYPTVSQIKEKLNKFTEARENADEAIEMYGKKYWYPTVPADLSEITAIIKEKLSDLRI